MFYLCSPCKLGYSYITHLEESVTEWPYLLKVLQIENETHVPGKYQWSPATKDQIHWSTIPRSVLQFFDFQNTGVVLRAPLFFENIDFWCS